MPDALDFTASIKLAAGISTLALAATVIPGGVIADRYGCRASADGGAAGRFFGATHHCLRTRYRASTYWAELLPVWLWALFGASYALLREVAESVGPCDGLYNVANVVVALTFAFLSVAPWQRRTGVSPSMLLPVLSNHLLFIVPGAAKGATAEACVEGPPGNDLGRFIGVVGVLYGISNAAVDIANPKCWLPILIGFVSFAAFAILKQAQGSRLPHQAACPSRVPRHSDHGYLWEPCKWFHHPNAGEYLAILPDWNTVQVSGQQLPMSVAGSLVC